MTRLDDAFQELLKARTTWDVDQVVNHLGKAVDWIPLGNNPANYGLMKTGSDPYNGITERITNAMDAMIELEVELKPELKRCPTPRAAVEAIYGLKDGNLRDIQDAELGQVATNIKVRFLDGSEAKKPTIEFLDRGIGRHPSEFPSTLLGLGTQYKVTRFYLIGAYGQGGQTSFAYADYGLVVSRKHRRLLAPGQGDKVGWSIVRLRDPSTETELHKFGRWEYCTVAGTLDVPTADPVALPFAFENGTLIRLVSYELPRGSSDVLQPASTAWSFLSQALFDPVLPIRLFEERERFEKRDRPLSGLARRLFRGGKESKAKVTLSNTYRLELGANGFARLNYWALTPLDETERWSDIRKGLVSPGQAVFVTINGQRHHVEPTSFLRDKANLTYANDHVIVQVDCDGLSKDAKKRLITSTRERMIEGEAKDQLLDEIADHLRQDRPLLAFEEERKRRFLQARSTRDTTRIRKLVGRFIADNPDLKDLIRARADEKETGEKAERKPAEPTDEAEEEIAPEELVVPELKAVPSFLRVANRRDPIPVEKGGSALVRLETDASDEYFEESWDEHFRAIHLGNLTARKSVSALRGGKISYYLHCPSITRVGSRETVRFELDLPGGDKLSVDRDVTCVKPIDRTKAKGETRYPQPNIVPLSQSKDPELWQELSWSQESVGRVYLGKTSEPGIYVNMDNAHLKGAARMHGGDKDLLTAIEDRYVSGVAYYLVLRKAEELRKRLREEESGTSGDSSLELDLVARTLAAVSIPFEKLGATPTPD
jgi:hypothetical protein